MQGNDKRHIKTALFGGGGMCFHIPEMRDRKTRNAGRVEVVGGACERPERSK